MALVGLITDTHLGVRNDNAVFHEYFKKSFQHFFEEIDRRGIKYVIHAGDLFDRRKYLNFITARLCREYFLEQLEKRNIETHIILGNHDVYYKNTNSCNSLDEILGNRYDYIGVYSSPALINIDGLNIQLLPWISEDDAEESYAAIKRSKAPILIGHLELTGFEMFRGIVSTHGIDRKTFQKFDQVYSGHYHHKSSSDNIHYLGAFAEYTWSDYNDPRGFHIFDTDTRSIEFVQNPHVIYKTMQYDDVADPDILDTVNKIDYGQYKDTYVKIFCKNRTNHYAFELMFDALTKAHPVDISIVENNEFDTVDDDSSDSVQDTPSIMNSYIDTIKQSMSVDPEKMKTFMKDIYVEAISIEDVE